MVAFVIIIFIAYAEHANSRGKCLWLTVNQAWLASLWKTVEGKRKKNLCASKPFKRAQLNCENSEEKSSSATCLHIERTFKYHHGGYYTLICICVQHILYFILYYTHYRSRSTTIPSRLVPRTPQHASNDFARGSFELFPKAIGTDVFICKARNSYWKLFTKNIRKPTSIRYILL